MFTVFSADITGNPGNLFLSPSSCRAGRGFPEGSRRHDYVCAEYQNNIYATEKTLSAALPSCRL